MWPIKHRKFSIKFRIAFVYSIFVLITGIGIILFLSLALQNSMKEQPVTSDITSVTYAIAVKSSEDSSAIIYEAPAVLPTQSYTVTASQLNSFLSSQIFKRLTRYSLIAVGIILVGTFFLSYFLSKRLLKPLTTMAKTTHRITAENFNQRLVIPENDDELKELADSFNNTLDGLQTAFYELERFNAYASHELKNSLAVMKTRLEVDVMEGGDNETVRFAISQVDRISKSVNDILAISSRNLKDSSELVDLALVAAQAVDEYRITGRRIMLDIPEEGVLPVRGKEIWFQRVIANLLDNAVKHTEDASPIQVNVRQCHGAVVVSVSDSGEGIDGSKRDLIWEPYFTSASNTRKSYGLGLAMVNHIVDTCGGLVWVDSKPGKGSSFYISLPAVKTA